MNENETPDSVPLEAGEMTVPLGELAKPMNALACQLGKVNQTLDKQNKASDRRTRLGAIAAVVSVSILVIVGLSVSIGLAQIRANQREIKRQGEQIALQGEIALTESLRRELDVTEHRLRKEDCLIRTFNEVVENRINARNPVSIKLCATDKELPDLEERITSLEARIKEREALGFG